MAALELSTAAAPEPKVALTLSGSGSAETVWPADVSYDADSESLGRAPRPSRWHDGERLAMPLGVASSEVRCGRNRTRRQGLLLVVELTTGQTAVKAKDLRRGGLGRPAGRVMEDCQMGNNPPSTIWTTPAARRAASIPDAMSRQLTIDKREFRFWILDRNATVLTQRDKVNPAHGRCNSRSS